MKLVHIKGQSRHNNLRKRSFPETCPGCIGRLLCIPSIRRASPRLPSSREPVRTMLSVFVSKAGPNISPSRPFRDCLSQARSCFVKQSSCRFPLYGIVYARDRRLPQESIFYPPRNRGGGELSVIRSAVVNSLTPSLSKIYSSGVAGEVVRLAAVRLPQSIGTHRLFALYTTLCDLHFYS